MKVNDDAGRCLLCGDLFGGDPGHECTEEEIRQHQKLQTTKIRYFQSLVSDVRPIVRCSAYSGGDPAVVKSLSLQWLQQFVALTSELDSLEP